jgi:hypothetical protein
MFTNQEQSGIKRKINFVQAGYARLSEPPILFSKTQSASKINQARLAAP